MNSLNSEIIGSVKNVNNIYDRIILTKTSKFILILRTSIISFCCIFFPLEAVSYKQLQEIERELYVEKFANSTGTKTELNFVNFLKSSLLHKIVDYTLELFGGSESIQFFMNAIYIFLHPFIGLKLVIVCHSAQFFLNLLVMIFQGHRPFWDIEKIETICRNSYSIPSVRVFFTNFFLIYTIISINLMKRKKFSCLQKFLMFLLYILEVSAFIIILGGILILYLHQIVYTIIIGLVVITILVDYDTNIHNFIFKTLKNAYNTRVYKMKLFLYMTGLFFSSIIMLYFINESEKNKVKDNIIGNPDCTDQDLEMFGIRESFQEITCLFCVAGAFWGASFTVEKNVGKWWGGNFSCKFFLVKVISVLTFNAFFITLKVSLKKCDIIYELYIAIKILLDYFQSYCVYGLLPLLYEHFGFNEKYISKKFEKIKVGSDYNKVQLFRTSIFEDEKKGKKDQYVVIERSNTDVLKKEDTENLNNDSLKRNLTTKNLPVAFEDNEKAEKYIDNEENIIKENEKEDEEDDDNDYQPTGFIENLKHKEEEVMEFFIDNEKIDINDINVDNSGISK